MSKYYVWRWILPKLLLVLFMLPVAGCEEDPASPLKRQSNAQITFYGLAVDQDGKPLQGVAFEVVVDSIPKDWTFETRGKPYDRTRKTVVSGPDGRFSFESSAHLIFVENGRISGYRHLFPQWSDDGNTGYQVTAWGDQLYKSDPGRPAVYVFVKNGVNQVSALPSRGGFQASGKQWIPNVPAWPNRPSLKDVVYKPSSTQPTSPP